eukprot:TRINITY_DN20685_c0_g1_i17.p1 TRINITY_DN20685_c0_g1~~TRINITY_DN20685_c0_g1_i17.p1  ORF type:complete len:200 (-),score=36.44 TRINITY_DN20685_c0_g1_i17:540-1139(-)
MMAAAEVSVEGAESVAEHLQPPAEEQEQAEEGQENSAAPQFASNIASKPRGASSPLYGEASGGGDVFVAATDAELSVVDQSASTCAPDAAHSMSTAACSKFSGASIKPAEPTASNRSKLSRLTSIDDPALLRGTDYVEVLRRCGRILRSNEGGEKTYSLSKPLDQLDAFISHNWSVPSLTKFLALALHFNAAFAAMWTL